MRSSNRAGNDELDEDEFLLGEAGSTIFAGPFTSIEVKPNNDLAAMMQDSTFYVSMRVKTGTKIGGDLMLIGSTGKWCSGLIFFMRAERGGELGVGHQVSECLVM